MLLSLGWGWLIPQTAQGLLQSEGYGSPTSHADLSVLRAGRPSHPSPTAWDSCKHPHHKGTIVRSYLFAIRKRPGTGLGCPRGWAGRARPCPPATTRPGTMACKRRLWPVPAPLRAQPGASIPAAAPARWEQQPNSLLASHQLFPSLLLPRVQEPRVGSRAGSC